MTIIELSESDKVCHASAVNAIEPDTIPAHSFNPNNPVFTSIEINPSIYPACLNSNTPGQIYL